MRNNCSNESLSGTLDRGQLRDYKSTLFRSIDDTFLQGQIIDGCVRGRGELIGEFEETE